MIQKTLTPTKQTVTIKIPKEYLNTELEIIIKPKYEMIFKTSGILKNIDITKWEENIKNEWNRISY